MNVKISVELGSEGLQQSKSSHLVEVEPSDAFSGPSALGLLPPGLFVLLTAIAVPLPSKNSTSAS